MDKASQVLAQGVPPGVPISYRALADHYGNVSHSTLHHRARGRPSREEKAQGQQYLKPYEEEVIVKYLLKMSSLGYPIRMKFKKDIIPRIQMKSKVRASWSATLQTLRATPTPSPAWPSRQMARWWLQAQGTPQCESRTPAQAGRCRRSRFHDREAS
jgi:hypothetical protein